MFVFFFFQAEDGIRDGHVTGVQTCALPISDWVAAMPDATLAELREQLRKKARVAVSRSTICRGLQALGLTRKKRPSAPPKPTPKSAPRSKSANGRWGVKP